jgi:hypothetical protein
VASRSSARRNGARRTTFGPLCRCIRLRAHAVALRSDGHGNLSASSRAAREPARSQPPTPEQTMRPGARVAVDGRQVGARSEARSPGKCARWGLAWRRHRALDRGHGRTAGRGPARRLAGRP